MTQYEILTIELDALERLDSVIGDTLDEKLANAIYNLKIDIENIKKLDRFFDWQYRRDVIQYNCQGAWGTCEGAHSIREARKNLKKFKFPLDKFTERWYNIIVKGRVGLR